MSSFFLNLVANVRALAPEYAPLLNPGGWCYGLVNTLHTARSINAHGEYQDRLQGLGRDLTNFPLTVNNKKYYSFSEMRQDYDELKLKKNLSSSEQDFVDGINETLAFLNATLIYLEPSKIKFMQHPQNADKSFPFAMPLTLEKLSLDKNPQLLSIYHHPIKLSKTDPYDFMDLLSEIDKLPNSEFISFTISSLNHSIAILKVENQWVIFNQNDITDQSFYQKLNMKNLVEALNDSKTLVDKTFCNLTAYISPLIATKADAMAINKKLEATQFHKNLMNTFIKARDERGPNNISPIEIASREGHLEMVKKLITPNIHESPLGKELLSQAAYDNYDLVKFYLEKKIPIDYMDGTTSILEHAADSGDENIVKLLLNSGVNVNYQDKEKNTAVHHAAVGGHLNVIKLLLNAKAKIDMENNNGHTPLAIAVCNGYVEVAEFLIANNANVDTLDKNNSNLLHHAVYSNDINTVNLLLEKNKKFNPDQHNKQQVKPIYHAVENGNFELFKILLTKGTTLNINDSYLLPLAAKSGSVDIVNYLIENQKFDINTIDKDGKTALHFAAEYGHREVVKYLLKEKANVDALDSQKTTPVHLAALKGHTTITQLLVNHGANFALMDSEGGTALLNATLNGFADICRFLVNKGAYVNEHEPNTGNTPLHAAAMFNCSEIAQFLIDNGADINILNFKNQTPLLLAAYEGQAQLAAMLASKGGSIDISSEENKIALYSFLQNKEANPKAARILLETLAPQNNLSKDVVLNLLLIDIKKIPWQSQHLFNREPNTIMAVEQIIKKTYQQTSQQPLQATTLWNKAFDDVINKITQSLNKKGDSLFGLFKRDPSTTQRYQDILNLLQPYASVCVDQKNKLRGP